MSRKTKDIPKRSSSQLFSFMRDSYLDRTSRPIYAVMFLLPLIIFYEIGTLLISPEMYSESITQIRVVSFVFIQNLLEYIGFSEKMTWLITPLVVLIILLALQITSRTKWTIKMKDLFFMVFECIILALPLLLLSLMFNRSLEPQQNVEGQLSCSSQVQQMMCLNHSTEVSGSGFVSLVSTPEIQQNTFIVDLVTGLGAGIYEELVFRLILICLLMIFFQDFLRINRNSSIWLSVFISALLFSAHHHIFFINGDVSIGEAFSLVKFSFRFFAGIYFSFIFAIRGFGVTAGAHAFYDIIAAVINASLFVDDP